MASDNKKHRHKISRIPAVGTTVQEPKGDNFLGRSWFWLVLAVLVLFGSRFFFSRPTDTSNMIGLNEVAQYVSDGKASRIVVQGDLITVELDDGEEARSRKESGHSLLETLKSFGVSDEDVGNTAHRR